MGKKEYKIVCWNTDNEFILGKVSGIISALVYSPFEDDCVLLTDDKYTTTFTFRATLWQYVKMRKVINKLYPGLCKFDA